MKAIFNYHKSPYFLYLITILGIGITSCSKDLVYENNPGIYIDKEKMISSRDSIAYSFAEKSDTRTLDTIYLPIKISGEVSNVDRNVPLVVNAAKTTATAGTHFQILESRVKANELTATAAIQLKRTADLKSKQLRIYLEIVPNADFPLVIAKTKTNNTYNGEPMSTYNPGYLIKLTDQLLKPDTWDGSGSWFKYYFGNYSAVKFKFIIEVTGRTVWGDRARYGPDAPTSAELKVYYTKLVTALYEYEQAHGPMIDETGNQVTFPKI
ncbi:hypothetical protein ABIE26_002291 [Pedobacter africanus]|uniref:Uncharacterized protein n=1 Tax=Pedobacter africanus TaxID=151894 RepID=A0ACC6KYT9_9SPHI|nr:DUF4843 domain-containing protein [Pedobacter africanus]MDR6784320.1 hypothetical protein [Pedobacter africanus]